MTFTYLMGILPVLLDFSISDVVNNIMLLASALAFLQIYAYFQLPKKPAEAWEKSPMHISNGKYYFLCCLSLFAYNLHFYQFLQKPETSGSNHQSDSHCSMHGLRMVLEV